MKLAAGKGGFPVPSPTLVLLCPKHSIFEREKDNWSGVVCHGKQ